MQQDDKKRNRQIFTELIKARWGSSISPPLDRDKDPDSTNELSNDEPYESTIPNDPDPIDATGRLLNLQPQHDTMLHMELMLPHLETMRPAKVIGWTLDSIGCTSGEYNSNSIFNSIIYDVEFDDGAVKEYAANVIAKNLLGQVDDKGFTLLKLVPLLVGV